MFPIDSDEIMRGLRDPQWEIPLDMIHERLEEVKMTKSAMQDITVKGEPAGAVRELLEAFDAYMDVKNGGRTTAHLIAYARMKDARSKFVIGDKS